MAPLVGDTAAYVRYEQNGAEGVTCAYIDDFIHAGTKVIEEGTKQSLAKFSSKPRLYENFHLFAFQTRTVSSGVFSVSQPYYTINVSFVPKYCTFDEFRRHDALFSWLSHSRPVLLRKPLSTCVPAYVWK